MPLHERLGEILAALQLRTFAAGTYDHHVAQLGVICKIVGYTRHQRCLRTNDDHLHIVAEHKLANGAEVVHLQVDVLATGVGAGVAGSDEELLAEGRLGYLVGDSVLTTARTEKKYIHNVRLFYAFGC